MEPRQTFEGQWATITRFVNKRQATKTFEPVTVYDAWLERNASGFPYRWRGKVDVENKVFAVECGVNRDDGDVPKNGWHGDGPTQWGRGKITVVLDVSRQKIADLLLERGFDDAGYAVNGVERMIVNAARAWANAALQDAMGDMLAELIEEARVDAADDALWWVKSVYGAKCDIMESPDKEEEETWTGNG